MSQHSRQKPDRAASTSHNKFAGPLMSRLGLLTLCGGSLLLWMGACHNDSQSLALMSESDIVAPDSSGYRLFQANCAACHGEIGNGRGAAAIALNVRPRDFWNEPFRYVSTFDAIPTREDLAQTIKSGRVHGEMPAAPWLSDEEVLTLADYVLELNRLGWVQSLSEDETLTRDDIAEISLDRITPLETIEVVMPSAEFQPSTTIGRALFIESCASCHGERGRGDGMNAPLDDNGIPIVVRDLTGDPIRGGDDPIELYKRIRAGVPGTPMPAQPGLASDDAWQLVFYTRELLGRPLGQSSP